MMKLFTVVLLFFSIHSFANSKTPMFECELLLGGGGRAQLPKENLKDVVPGLLQLIRNHQPIELYLSAYDKKITKAQATPLKRELKKLGAETTLVGLGYTEFHAGIIRLTEASVEALPKLLEGLSLDYISVEVGSVQVPSPPQATRAKAKTPRPTPARDGEGGRRFQPISIEELKKKIPEDVLDFSELSSALKKDLSKVEFESANLTIDATDHPEYSKILGYHTLSNGLTFLGAMASGDTSIPIYYIVYWDGEALRAFIPKNGNLWNPKTKAPFGDDPTEDIEFLRQHRPDLAGHSDEDMFRHLRFDEVQLLKEVEGRLKPR